MKHAALILIALLLTACDLEPPPQAVFVGYYEVSASCPTRVTYRNSFGGTEQQDAPAEWRQNISVRPGQFLYISAQLTCSGSVRASIYGWDQGTRDFKLLRTSTSSGSFSIASASTTY